MSLDQLSHINLVGKVCDIQYKSIQVNDQDLAEYLIEQAEGCKTYGEFSNHLREVEAGLDDNVMQNIYSLSNSKNTSKLQEFAKDEDAKLYGLKSVSVTDYVMHHKNEKAVVMQGLAIPDGIKSADFEKEGFALSNVADIAQRIESRDSSSRESKIRPNNNHTVGSGRYDARSTSTTNDDRDRDYRGSSVDVYSVVRGEVSTVSPDEAWVNLPSGKKGILDQSAYTRHVGSGVKINLREKLRVGQSVWVKVLSILQDKCVVSMRDVDQRTGTDLNVMTKTSSNTTNSSSGGATHGGLSKKVLSSASGISTTSTNTGSLTDQWHKVQLVNSGVLGHSAAAVTQSLTGNLQESDDTVDIDITDKEPTFLKGLTQFCKDEDMHTVKMVDGGLHRAAMTQAVLTKERRDVREKQRAEEAGAMPVGLNKAWEDPMASSQSRMFAGEVKSLNERDIASRGVPEWKKAMIGATFGKVSTQSMKEQREGLPVFQLRQAFLDSIAAHQVVVVVGETGSGKTTQMTQYLAEAGYSQKGIIGCTQPRRVAAISVAKRVAEEVGCPLGSLVGYSVRFDDCTSSETKIKYMTDGLLQRELLLTGGLDRYSVLILDEAHERTINTDVLFGLQKAAMRKRADLKVIITSATLDAEKFSKYFFNCPVFTIPGRLYPVTVLYSEQVEVDYLEAALLTVMQIHLTQKPGDILLFLTGKEEIDTACEILYERCKKLGRSCPPLDVLPVYSSLPSEVQSRIFEPTPVGTRKCVVATNIAEASLTIDGIYYVVDPGFCKLKTFDAKLGMDTLQVTPISQASANQRAGRAGRTGPGKCFRLYTEPAFKNEMQSATPPEIQRTNLGSTVLMLKALGINDQLGFDFMDPPPLNTLVTALQELYTLGALDEEGLQTRMGKRMAELPLEPMLSKTLMTSVDLGCSEEICTVVAMLSVEEVFHRPKDKQAQADAKKAQFSRPEGDHLTLLSVYDAWTRAGQSASWCTERFVSARSLKQAFEVRKQLVDILERQGFTLSSCGKQIKRVCMSIAAGYFRNAAKKDGSEGYKTLLEGQQTFVHPSSSVFQKQPEWVLYHKLVLTTKEYMHECLVLDPKWLVDLAPQMFQQCDAQNVSQRRKKEKIQPLFDRHNPPDAWRLSKRQG